MTIITALPTPVPSRTDPTNFSQRGDNFLGALPAFATQTNAVASELNAANASAANSASTAATSATSASNSAISAANSAADAASSSGAQLWVSGTNYTTGTKVYSPANKQNYRRITSGAGTTDPSLDPSNWAPILLEISTQYPNVRPSLNLDFANSKKLDPRITFARSTPATYYDGKTQHIVDENQLTYSEEFDNAVWGKAGATVSANQTTGPFGVSNADQINEGTSNSAHYIAQEVYVTVGKTYTFSTFVKNTDRGFCQLATTVGPFTATTYVNFNITSGTVTAQGAGTTGTITDYGNGWFRLTLTATAVATGNASFCIANITAGADARLQGYTGTSKSIYVFGAQVEQKSFVSHYTKTTSDKILKRAYSLKTASSGVARFEHSPITGDSKGLLIEPAATNLIPRSQEFDNASWVKNESFITTNSCLAPDGTLSADKLSVSNTSSVTHRIAQNFSVTTGVTYVFSVYVKPAEYEWVVLIMYHGASANSAYYNVKTLTQGTLGSQTLVSAEQVGGGWVRLSIAGISTATETTASCVIGLSPNGTEWSHSGNVGSGLYVWGAQVESKPLSILEQATPSSYIKTEGSQVGKAADEAYITGQNFTNFYNQDEGTLQAVVDELKPDSRVKGVLGVSSGSYHDSISLMWRPQGIGGETQIYKNDQFVSQFTVSTNGKNYGFRYLAGDSKFGLGGSLTTSHASTQLPTVDRLLIGGIQSAPDYPFGGCIRKVIYYPKALSDTELRAVTLE